MLRLVKILTIFNFCFSFFRAGGGTAVFAAEGEDLRPKVMIQLKNAMQPSISEVKVEWDGLKVCYVI